MISAKAVLTGWESYKKTLEEYIKLTRKDLGFIIAKKTDSLRIRLLRGLKGVTPAKNKIQKEAKFRGFRTKLTSDKAKLIANRLFPTKAEYIPEFSAAGIPWKEGMMQLTPEMLSRILANKAELSTRQKHRFYHASTWTNRLKIPTSPTKGTLSSTSVDNKNKTVISLDTASLAPNASIRNTAPRVAELLYGKSILSNALAAEQRDMADYIGRKLNENKKVIK